ncbi:MAG: hypothetical protein EOO50_14915 [Flavobacterium sp.]|uniref:hypothetical protein n=1 Tax=Flavobacterium sp. TaxID=239 RepID=UPI00121C734F|nr:hypothetical protein [Flavobacterium sp.]RZJ65129.1 MAG: hypothetical protein EOO50_14915 [Flavobacterium sp.]
MKKITFTVAVFVLSFLCKAQVVEYDFAKGAYTSGIKIESGSKTGKFTPLSNNGMVTFKIKNINTFRYRVEIVTNNVDYVTEMSDELRVVFRQGTSDATKVNAAAEQIKETTNLMKLQAEKSTSAEFKSAMDELANACEKYSDAVNEIAKLEMHRMSLINMAARNKKKEQLPEDYVWGELKKKYEAFVDTYADASAKYAAAKALVDKAKADSNVKKSLISNDIVENAYEEVEEAHKSINKTNVLKLLEDVYNLQNSLKSDDTFSVTSGPVYVNGSDFIAFTITITPTPAADYSPNEPTIVLNGEIPVKRGLKVDFSVGPVFSFGSGAKDERYYLQDSETEGSSVLLKRDNGDVFTPGLAAMMHIYQRTSNGVAVGGMFGVGAGFQSMEEANASFYTGISLVMGKSQKVMINGGVSFFGVDRLKNKQFVVEEEYVTDNIDLSTITEKVLKTSFFLSLSYNISTRTLR